MKDLVNYDFSGKRVKFFNSFLGRVQSLTKFDVAYHLDQIDSKLPWTVMFDAFSYSELKEILKQKLS